MPDMASYTVLGNSTDNSSSWSDYIWDDRGFWVSTRYGPSGDLEYDYKSSETLEQTSKQDHATPRTPDADYIKQPDNLKFSYETVHGGRCTAQGDQTHPGYTTNNSSFNASQGRRSYWNTPSSYAQDDKEYATSSISANSQLWSSNSESNATNQSNQKYGAGDLITPLAGINIRTTTPLQQQGYSNSSNYQATAGKSTSRAVSSTTAELDERYKVVEPRNQKKFWQVGRVFMVLWTEPAGIHCAGREKGTQHGSQISSVYLNGTAYTEIRRFVVIGEGYGNSICSPIHTYSGQATLKSNLPDAKQHAIIHTSKNPPEEHTQENEDGTIIKESLPKEPIRVVSEQAGEEGDLGALSRVNYAKLYTVEHYVRVLNVGKVHPASMPSLEKNSMFNRRVDEPPQPPRGQPSSSSRKDSSKKKSSTKSSSGRKHSSKNDE